MQRMIEPSMRKHRFQNRCMSCRGSFLQLLRIRLFIAVDLQDRCLQDIHWLGIIFCTGSLYEANLVTAYCFALAHKSLVQSHLNAPWIRFEELASYNFSESTFLPSVLGLTRYVLSP